MGAFNKRLTHNMSAKTTPERVTKAASLNTDLAQWAEEQAKAENRSFSNYIETLLQRAKQSSSRAGSGGSPSPALAA
jgi:hypothetical protein